MSEARVELAGGSTGLVCRGIEDVGEVVLAAEGDIELTSQKPYRALNDRSSARYTQMNAMRAQH